MKGVRISALFLTYVTLVQSDDRLDVNDRRTIQGVQALHVKPVALPPEKGHLGHPDAVGAIWAPGGEHAPKRDAGIPFGMHFQGTTLGAVQDVKDDELPDLLDAKKAFLELWEYLDDRFQLTAVRAFERGAAHVPDWHEVHSHLMM
jgi:hypothetical protein